MASKRRIENDRDLPQNKRLIAEDESSRASRNSLGWGINRTKAILGHIRTSGWMKQGKRDSQQR